MAYMYINVYNVPTICVYEPDCREKKNIVF